MQNQDLSVSVFTFVMTTFLPYYDFMHKLYIKLLMYFSIVKNENKFNKVNFCRL